MSMLKSKKSPLPALLLGLALLAVPACGGGGSVEEGTGRGLKLVAFSHSGVDNAVLNSSLEFRFSEAVDPSTISTASIQLREGPSFGSTVKGTFSVNGSVVIFEPQLAALCDHSDSGFKPDTQYRVQAIGFPEEFSIRNTQGQSLSSTSTYEFHTRLENDPDRYADQIPGVGPSVVSTSPADSSQAVPVVAGNRIEIVLSENIDPCTVDDTTVLLHMYEVGDPLKFADVPNASSKSGFYNVAANSTADQAPGDHTTWGADNTTSLAGNPQKVLAHIELQQNFTDVTIVITPLFGYNADPAKNASKFPENALLVVQLNFNILDYGGQPLLPHTFSFTTENLPQQDGEYMVENEGETPYVDGLTTADVNTARAPGKAQGFMLFAGDGDNGIDQLRPSLPETPVSGCTVARQPNSGFKDDFDPFDDVLLDTGSTVNTCDNVTDASRAVVWEFNTFRIRNGVTVRVVGVNAAIILVQGDVRVDAGGRLLLRGDASSGAPQGRGGNGWNDVRNSGTPAKGGVGVAGGGGGGDGTTPPVSATTLYGHDGDSAVGSPDGYGVEGGAGAGLGGVATRHAYGSAPWPAGSSQGGGGGGHAMEGMDATATIAGGVSLYGAVQGDGGGVYPTSGEVDRMLKAEAGGGGGAAGFSVEVQASFSNSIGGGGGGAGGGFVDLTSAGDIYVFGSIDAAGSRGGGGGTGSFYGGGGGGGGAGGGVRLLTPRNINVSGGAISTAGGAGGTATDGTGGGVVGPLNPGGVGGVGRIVLEDGDSIISGLNLANLSPSEGGVGFFRGVFEATRFQGGGLEPQATSDVFAPGPFNPTYVEPVQNYGVQEDFKAGIPVGAAPGVGSTGLLIEVRGYQALPDGTPDASTETDWFSIGSFKDTGVDVLPAWVASHPGDIAVPSDNALNPGSPNGSTGSGFAGLNGTGAGGFEFIQFRFTMYLPNTVGPFDPGAYIDSWSIRFSADQ